jgi:hypothetical protein
MKDILIAIDVDGTLRNNTTEEVVANEEIRTLLIILSKFKNVKILVWSGGGELYARQVCSSLGISEYVDRYASKEYIKCPDCTDPDECTHHVFGTKIKPDIAIDDIHECELGAINLIVKQK